tara:strand:- start:682 stop:1545 length:864 start_codon:yes stop_codon:yes gene_type:complete
MSNRHQEYMMLREQAEAWIKDLEKITRQRGVVDQEVKRRLLSVRGEIRNGNLGAAHTLAGELLRGFEREMREMGPIPLSEKGGRIYNSLLLKLPEQIRRKNECIQEEALLHALQIFSSLTIELTRETESVGGLVAISNEEEAAWAACAAMAYYAMPIPSVQWGILFPAGRKKRSPRDQRSEASKYAGRINKGDLSKRLRTKEGDEGICSNTYFGLLGKYPAGGESDPMFSERFVAPNSPWKRGPALQDFLLGRPNSKRDRLYEKTVFSMRVILTLCEIVCEEVAGDA